MFRVDTLNSTTFEESLRIPPLTGNANKFAKTLVDAVLAACDASMVARRCHNKQKAPVYWWNASINEARRRCLQCRRQYQRARGMPEFFILQAQYKLRRRELKLAIKESKRKCFFEMCNAAENDIWGAAYKVAMKKLNANKPATPNESQMKLIVETLFPNTSVISPRPTRIANTPDVHDISPEEILAVAARLQDQKAPGPDAIPNKALKLAARLQPEKICRSVQ
ncbi:uncharacterized protein [Drosophila tropicalis]|uniref:uncharacterized protein n=1 Tax=Drosophila tropicalis TaxID=46794 RepID=UPI0035ABCA86